MVFLFFAFLCRASCCGKHTHTLTQKKKDPNEARYQTKAARRTARGIPGPAWHYVCILASTVRHVTNHFILMAVTLTAARGSKTVDKSKMYFFHVLVECKSRSRGNYVLIIMRGERGPKHGNAQAPERAEKIRGGKDSRDKKKQREREEEKRLVAKRGYTSEMRQARSRA